MVSGYQAGGRTRVRTGENRFKEGVHASQSVASSDMALQHLQSSQTPTFNDYVVHKFERLEQSMQCFRTCGDRTDSDGSLSLE